MNLDPSKLCQIEIPVHDLNKARSFYEEVLGFHESLVEIYDTVVIDVGEGSAYGISLVRTEDVPMERGKNKGITLHFSCDNPEEVIGKARDFGIKNLSGPKTVPGYGILWEIEDPDGHRIGLFKKY
ncbi:MAG: VOC family protein [Oligoflexales bacterium]|nr:VOC family protein [Oligoflexales bacterium]